MTMTDGLKLASAVDAWNHWKLDNQAAAFSCHLRIEVTGFPLIAQAAKIALATPASPEAICEGIFKRAKHMGITDRMTHHHPSAIRDARHSAIHYNKTWRRGGNRGEHAF